MHVVQARQPEAQRGGPQQRRPRFALVRRQRAHRIVRRDHRGRELVDKAAVDVAGAPVVDGDREVVREEIGRREAEVDDARHPIAGKQHVVAEEIAVDRALGQLAAAESGLKFDLAVEQRHLRGVETRLDRACGLAPPRRSAAIGQARAIGLRRDVQPRQRSAHVGAVHRRWRLDRRAVDTRDEARGLAVEQREQCAGAIGHRRRHFDAGAREMRHQIQIERQLAGRQALVQREDVTAALGRHEIVGVLDARRNGLQFGQTANRIAREPGVEFGSGDRCVNGHAYAPAGITAAPVFEESGGFSSPGEQ